MIILYYCLFRRSLLPFLLLIAFGAGAQQKDSLLPLSETIKNYRLGSTTLPVHILVYGATDSLVFINVHDDEITSVKAAQSILQKTGGVLIRIANNNQRRVPFVLKGESYDFDPNRIFSEARRNTVSKTGASGKYIPEAIDKVKNFSIFLLQQIPSATRTLIALHNNKPDILDANKKDSGLHIYNYLWPRVYHREAVEVHVNARHDPDDFFFTTDSVLLRQLSAFGFNAVLQHPEPKDDGSLSVYYGRLGKSYINVEAEHNHLNEQRAMIAALCRILKEVNPSPAAD